MKTEKLVHPFLPVYDENTRVLILGSFPSIKSREAGFYYMNPHNRFFQVLGALLNENLVDASVEEKTKLLLKHRIGLFDVVRSCKIKGSQDASITEVEVNDLAKIIRESRVERIFLNGKLAYKLFLKYFPQYASRATLLPSTSPANASYRLTDLIEKWQVILF